jgi:hypothetical protein
MKNNNLTLSVLLLACACMVLQSCSKALDNDVAYPTSKISGAFLYNGQPVGMLGTSNDLNTTNNNQNPLQLEQTGPGTFTSANIKMFARPDGTYTILTFDGDYNLKVLPGKSPFLTPAPIKLSLKGEAKDVNFNVTPYFWVSNYQTTFVDSVFTATFKLQKIVSTATLEKVAVYFNTTNIADNAAKAFERNFTTAAQGVNIDGNCTIRVDLKTMSATERAAIRASTGVIYANVGVKTSTITDALYQKPVLLKP